MKGKKLQEETIDEAINTAVQEINAKDAETQNFIANENIKANISSDTNQSAVDSTAKATNINRDNYNIDAKNKLAAENEKLKSIGGFVNANAEATANMVNALGDNYGTDVQNFQNSLNAKIDALSAWGKEVGGYKIGGRAGMDKDSPVYDITKDILYQQQQLNKVQANYNKVQANANKVNVGNNVGIGNVGSSSGKDKTEKYQEDIENLADRYYELENALTDVENALKSLDTKMENASEEERIKLLDEEIALLAKKKKALEDILKEQRKEQNDLQYSLKTQGGFTFDGEGNITNYKQRMAELLAWANSSTDAETKKSAQETYKSLEKMVDDYTKLVKNSISDTVNQMDDITNAITESQKNISEILQKQKEDYISNLEDETNKLKDELQKRKDLMNKQWQTEDKEDELASKQDKINQLEADLAGAIRTGDEALQKSIRDQLAEAQKELNEFIRDSERDLANDIFDKESEALDKDLQNKIDEIEKQLGDEDLLALVQSGVRDLSDALNNIDKSTSGVNRSFGLVTDTVGNIGNIIGTTWINNLDKVLEKTKEIMGAFEDGITLNPKVVPRKNDNNNNDKELKIEPKVVINGITEDDLRRRLYKFSDEIIDTVMKEFDR